MGRGRGRLSKIDLLPPEVDDIISWAADELNSRERTQTEIYAEFVARLEAREEEYHGELDIDVPSFSAFNRHSIRLARLTRRLSEASEIAEGVSRSMTPEKSDNLSGMLAVTLKSLIMHMMGDPDFKPSEVMQLANAFRAASQAENVSTLRRGRAEAALKSSVEEAVETVAKSQGLTAETVEAIKAQILGVGK